MSTPFIHPTAVVDASAHLSAGCHIGPYCIIGPSVTLGENCWLQHHVSLQGPSHIGSYNKFFAFCSIGQQTQDLKYAGEPTHLAIGNRNTFREFCTVNRGTAPGAYTRIGNDCNFLAYSHIAHDCTVGNHVIFSNNGTIAGHVEVGDHVILGGLTAVHQFCRIGSHAISGGCSKIVQDVPPYMIADGNPAKIRGLNKVGLDRHGIPAETQKVLKEAYRILFRSDLGLQDALASLGSSLPDLPEIRGLLEFLQKSSRGILR